MSFSTIFTSLFLKYLHAQCENKNIFCKSGYLAA